MVAILSDSFIQHFWASLYKQKTGIKVYLVAFSFGVLGYWNSSRILQPKLSDDHISKLPLEKVIKVEEYTYKPSDPSLRMTSIYLEVRKAFVDNKWVKTKGKLKLNYRGKIELHKGSIIRVKVKLRKPAGYSNPRSFRYSEFLKKQEILFTGSALSPVEIFKSFKGDYNFFTGTLPKCIDVCFTKNKRNP